MGYNRRIKIRREVQCLMDALIQSLVQANFAPERIAPQASMAQYTTLRIGGPAEVMVNIHSADEIAVALRAAKQADAPVTIIGNGSNLLVRDGGIRGLVLRISGGLNAIRREGDCLLVQAGGSLAAVAAVAGDEGLSGMAELGGIPGRLRRGARPARHAGGGRLPVGWQARRLPRRPAGFRLPPQRADGRGRGDYAGDARAHARRPRGHPRADGGMCQGAAGEAAAHAAQRGQHV